MHKEMSPRKNNVIIRAMTKEDIQEIVKLQNTAFQHTAAKGVSLYSLIR